MTTLELLIQKVSKIIVFSNPISSGNVMEPRPADPRLSIKAYFVLLKTCEDDEKVFEELWLKQDGEFAITQIWYETSTKFSRKLHISSVKPSVISEYYEEFPIVDRLSTILQKNSHHFRK